MAWPEQQKQQTRQRILESAAQLFTLQGFDKVSIDDIMANAQLTRGAFYAHFSSKKVLYGEAIEVAASISFSSKMSEQFGENVSTEAQLTHLVKAYLNPSHLSPEEPSCPLAFLVSDVANAEVEVRETYTRVYKKLVIHLARLMALSPNSNEVLALSAMMIGAVAVANTLSDERTQTKLLEACEQQALQLIESIQLSVK